MFSGSSGDYLTQSQVEEMYWKALKKEEEKKLKRRKLLADNERRAREAARFTNSQQPGLLDKIKGLFAKVDEPPLHKYTPGENAKKRSPEETKELQDFLEENNRRVKEELDKRDRTLKEEIEASDRKLKEEIEASDRKLQEDLESDRKALDDILYGESHDDIFYNDIRRAIDNSIKIYDSALFDARKYGSSTGPPGPSGSLEGSSYLPHTGPPGPSKPPGPSGPFLRGADTEPSAPSLKEEEGEEGEEGDEPQEGFGPPGGMALE